MNLIRFKIKRQDNETGSPYWEFFEIRSKSGMTVSSALHVIRKRSINIDGRAVAPVVWEKNCLQETCGTCTIVINGIVKSVCTTFIEQLDQPIKLEPLSKFKVIRDLVVDKSIIYKDFQRINAWMKLDQFAPISTTHQVVQDDLAQSLIQCTHCAACLEACPQYHPSSKFVGALPMAQSYRYNAHRNGQGEKIQRLQILMQEGGVSDCDNAQNCVKVCPQEIPLTTAIGKVKRQVMGQVFKKFFG